MLRLGLVVAEIQWWQPRLPTFQAVEGQPRASSDTMSTTATNGSSMPPKRFGWWKRNSPGLVQQLLVLGQENARVLALLRALAQRRHDGACAPQGLS